MENLEAIKFDPNIAKLTTAVEVSKKITVTDLRDIKQLEAVKRSRIDLRAMEIEVEKTGKKYRQRAVDYSNAVIADEKKLKAITGPEIDRLKGLENEIKETAIKDLRIKKLPEKIEKLKSIGDEMGFSDEEILKMSEEDFVTYYNQRVANKNEADRIENERKATEAQDKLDKDRMELEQKQKKIDDEANRIEMQKEADKNAKEFTEKQKAQEEADKAAKAKKDQEELNKKKAYIKFLKNSGYTNENKDEFFQKKIGDHKVILYKKVGEFNL